MARAATMCGVRLTAHGGPEVLVWSDAIPRPSPGPGEVLVRVLAAGVNATDINTRLGWYAPSVDLPPDEGTVAEAGGYAGALRLPLIQGGDLCGRVVETGADVDQGWTGRRVTCPINLPEPGPGAPTAYRALGSDIDGAFAQFCVLPARHCHDVTASPLSDVEIAAMPCAYGTALNLLTRARVAAGQAVLITGASGGVGLAAVQMASQTGASVTAVCAPDKAQAVRAAGAQATLDRDTTPPSRQFDAVIDLVGGPGWAGRLAALKPGGTCAVSGAMAGPLVTMDLRRLYLDDLTILGCTYQPPEVFARLVAQINAGTLRPLVSRVYPLAEIAAAQADFQSKHHPGKIVLLPPEPVP